jgi:type I restriction enzyme S subunit
MPKINQQTVMAPPVMLPPPDEQAEIVRRVRELFSNADGLQRRYDVALGSLERLTPSVLAKAFRGELVPQDPNDEPAGELLERMRAAGATDGVSTTKIRAVGSRRQ